MGLWCSGIHRGSVDDEAIDSELGDQVDHHRASQDDVVHDAKAYQGITPPGGEGGEDRVVDAQLHHRLGNVVGALEGESSVDGEVVEDTCNEGGEVTGPVGEEEHLLEQGEDQDLDDPCTDGEEDEFDNLDQVLLFAQGCGVLFAHGHLLLQAVEGCKVFFVAVVQLGIDSVGAIIDGFIRCIRLIERSQRDRRSRFLYALVDAEPLGGQHGCAERPDILGIGDRLDLAAEDVAEDLAGHRHAARQAATGGFRVHTVRHLQHLHVQRAAG